MKRHCAYSTLNTQSPEGLIAWQVSFGIPATGTDM